MKQRIYFLILCIVLIIITVVSKQILETDQLLYTSLSSQLTKEQINNYIELSQKWQWAAYALIPVALVFKIGLISSVLYMGTFFFEKNMTFKKLFAIVTKAEFVFVAVGIVKLLWFVFQNDYTLQDVQNFYPLSALSIVGHEGLHPWFLYPFQTLNLFELAYWIILAWLLGKEIHSTTEKAFKIVASSYGSALLIWVLAIMFFTLNVS